MTAHDNIRGTSRLSQRLLCSVALACTVAFGAGLAMAQDPAAPPAPPPPPPGDPAAAPPPPPAAPPPPVEPAPVTTSADASMTTSMPMADPSATVTPQVESEAAPRQVGGHVGLATPFINFGDETTDIGDQFTLLTPIGIGVKVSERVVVDFEMVVANPIDPDGSTGLVIDPGVVYNAGPVALGLRLAFQIGTPYANVGLIPLVNKGLVDLGGATWFVEAAFPTFYMADDVTMSIVGHTGIGF